MKNNEVVRIAIAETSVMIRLSLVGSEMCIRDRLCTIASERNVPRC